MLSSLLKKMYCLLVFVLVLGFSIPTSVYAQSSTKSEGETETFTVLSKNFVTGEETLVEYGYDYTRPTDGQQEDENTVFTTPAFFPENDEFIMNSNVGEITIDSIIGSDDRTQVTSTTSSPYSALGNIVGPWDQDEDGVDDTTSYCTGFMEGPDLMVTAGHCVFDNGLGGWLTSLTYYPARNGSTFPFSSAGILEISISTQWSTYSNENYDYALVVLDRNVGGDTGWLGKGWSNGSLNGYDISVTGYPGDKTLGTMWTAEGEITSTLTYRLKHDVDTFSGQSGAPMYTTNGIVWGIHAKGTIPILLIFKNSGTRITEALYNMMQDKYLDGIEKYY